MTEYRFTTEEVSRGMQTTSLSEAFARFSVEVLTTDGSRFQLFPDRGKDGAIDFSRDVGGARTVGECKIVGTDGLAATQRRWREVAGRLGRNLASPDGPPPGQSQYRPWYRTDTAITRYIFCTSSMLANQEQVDLLTSEIKGFLQSLAEQHRHLAHLRSIDVIVVDWSMLIRDASAQTIFRWFPRSRPHGLLPLNVETQLTSFREYLAQGRMPHYSLARHVELHPPPDAAHIDVEQALVDSLEGGSTVGLLITGQGGLGKTRLTLEIGRVADARGWTVVRATETVSADDIDVLTERLKASERAVLVIDYVERHPGFAAIAEHIGTLAASSEVTIRYVASCRASFAPRVAGVRGQRTIDLSPVKTAPAAEWLRGYREATVRHIIRVAGLDEDSHAAVAGDRPVLAVFLAYLRATNRPDELAELLSVGDFGTWVTRRVSMSFRSTGVDRDLAMLAATFPRRVVPAECPRPTFVDLLDRLAADGWIERAVVNGESEYWLASHDVLMDQLVASYVRGIPATVDAFASELFEVAVQDGSLPAAIIALQRLVDVPEVAAVGWREVFERAIAADPESWRGVRLAVLGTPLISASDAVYLLGRHPEMWAGLESEPIGRLALARLAERALSESSLDASWRSTLEDRLEEAVAREGGANLVLSRALRFAPRRFATRAADWLQQNSASPKADYVLNAWLEAGLPPKSVAREVEGWLVLHGMNVSASFLLRAWMQAARDWQVAERYVGPWLQAHASSWQASFVFRGWFGAGGSPAAVRPFVAKWLPVHATDVDADFIYKSWLDAGGDPELVAPFLKSWLQAHATDKSAPFVFKPWLDAGGDPELVAPFLKSWLEANATEETAPFVFKPWLDAGCDSQLIAPFLEAWLQAHATEETARFVFKPWLDAGGDSQLVAPFLEAWLQAHATEETARFVYQPWLDAGGDREMVAPFLKSWLQAHPTDESAPFVFKPWLDAGGDRELVAPFLGTWLQAHATDESAPFVFKPWLDAGGDSRLIAPFLKSWLEANATEETARFVFKPWLDASGDSQLIGPFLKSWLQAYATDESARFIYQPWLDAGGDSQLIAPFLELWLQAYATDRSARFVFKPWLDAGGDPQLVAPFLEAWLQAYATDESARFVYQPWLDAGGDRDLVAPFLEAWLEANATDESARFVYQPWLDAGGDRELVAPFLEAWLQANATDKSAPFVFKPWLDAGGDPELVAPFLEAWLQSHATDQSAPFVFKPWLDAGGDPEIVRKEIEVWLTKHGATPTAGYVYSAWLKATADTQLVAQPIATWLAAHAEQRFAATVLQAWLNAGAPSASVAGLVRTWLARHPTSGPAPHLIQSWLRNGGNPADVRPAVETWVEQAGHTVRARYLYEAWLRADGDYDTIADGVATWFESNDDPARRDSLERALTERGTTRATPRSRSKPAAD